jgi:hypothetical protein
MLESDKGYYRVAKSSARSSILYPITTLFLLFLLATSKEPTQLIFQFYRPFPPSNTLSPEILSGRR